MHTVMHYLSGRFRKKRRKLNISGDSFDIMAKANAKADKFATLFDQDWKTGIF